MSKQLVEYLNTADFEAAHAQAFGGYNVDEDKLEPYFPAIGEVVFLFDWHRTAVVVGVNVDLTTVDVLITHMDDSPLEKHAEVVEQDARWVRSAEVHN